MLGKRRDYKLGSIDQSGSKDVVALVANTPSAIGYSGMGYVTPGVKMLKISRHKGEPADRPDRRKRQAEERRLSDHPAAVDLYRRGTQGQGEDGSWTGFWASKARKLSRTGLRAARRQ